MKKLSMLFCAGALISVLFAGCNESEQMEEGAEINPIPVNEVDDEVADFFEKKSDYSFKFIDESDQSKYEPVFLTINSPDEFSAAVSSSVELPYIDFDKYTLVVGRYYISGGIYLKSHTISIKSDVMIFNIVYGDTGIGFDVMLEQRFWSLYPKLPQKPVTFNIKTIKEYEL